MAGTFTGKSLADGQVANAEAAIYTVPASTVGYVKQVTFYNTNAATQTVNLWIRPSGGSSRQVRRFLVAQNESVDVMDAGETFELEAGDTIRASTTTATAVDYVVMGVEET